MNKRIDLNLEKGEESNIFLDYLNASIADQMSGFLSSSGYLDDGTFCSTSSVNVRSSDPDGIATFVIEISPEKRVKHLDIYVNDSSSKTELMELACDIVITAQTNAYKRAKQRFLFRGLLSYIGPLLSGTFRVGKWTISPLPTSDDLPNQLGVERIIRLDFSVDAVDKHQAESLARVEMRTQCYRLSLILDRALSLPDHSTMRWVLLPGVAGSPSVESKRLKLGFHEPLLALVQENTSGSKEKSDAFEGSLLTGQHAPTKMQLSFPQESRLIYRCLKVEPVPFADKFDACARMYYFGLALMRHSLTASLAYRMGAIEAIVGTGKGEDTTKFIKQFGPQNEDLESFSEYLYKDIRCSHFHSGSDALDRRDPILSYPIQKHETLDRSLRVSKCLWITRYSILSWVLKEATRIQGESEVNGDRSDQASKLGGL